MKPLSNKLSQQRFQLFRFQLIGKVANSIRSIRCSRYGSFQLFRFQLIGKVEDALH